MMQSHTSSARMFLFVLICFLMSVATVSAQTPDAYTAGYDVGYDAGAVYYLYGSPDDTTAYVQGGYAVYGLAFEEGFFAGFQEGYNMMGAENPYSGYFEFFKAWWDASQQAADGAVREIVVKRGAKRITRNFRRLNQLARRPVADGAFVKDILISADYSYASVEDDFIGGKGHDQEAAVFINGRVGDALSWGLGYAHDRYDITSNNRGFEQNTDALDAIVAYHLSDNTSLGLFVNASFIDVEDEALFGTVIPGDQFERWGAGLLATYARDLGQRTNLGLTASLASLNKRSLERVLDDEDTAAVMLIDLSHQLSDSVRFGVYGSYFGLVDRETSPEIIGSRTPDGSFWTWGSDVSMDLADDFTLVLGYETTAADNDHEEHRLNLALRKDF